MHGIAALNLALEGDELELELDSPAANIVGFEHAPSSADDHAALDTAVATLRDGDRLFRFNDEAGCRMESAEVSSELLDDDHEDHDDHQKHAGHEAHEAHSDAEPEGHQDEEHAHAGEAHSDIEAAYHFECEAPDKLTQLTVELFEAFSGMEKIEVQYVIESKQGAAELTAKDHVVKF
ncbi:DUF2796 domain-containing protein [Thioflavicoccus mobilis]|uniref:DUF2796 domain-containing protein n=1 Tax=Thioflavicoccus mobilis TaxID=80679 RepID=UPI0012FA14C5|nr:DUF2796 domain-containing protein [Thioflavicoccus mobilis]